MTTIPVPDGTTAGSSTYSSHNPYTERHFALREVRDYTQHLAGRIKTIADATFADPAQRKAVKDLIHDAIWTEHYTQACEWANQQSVAGYESDLVHELTAASNGTQFVSSFPFSK